MLCLLLGQHTCIFSISNINVQNLTIFFTACNSLWITQLRCYQHACFIEYFENASEETMQSMTLEYWRKALEYWRETPPSRPQSLVSMYGVVLPVTVGDEGAFMIVTHALGINKYRRWRARVGDPDRVLKRLYVALTLKHFRGLNTFAIFVGTDSQRLQAHCLRECLRKESSPGQPAARSSLRRPPLHDSNLVLSSHPQLHWFALVHSSSFPAFSSSCQPSPTQW